ncbi:MAG: NAD-dependent epimerase/dehydratase family protein [Bacteroidetes bacterium]|nr:NAD-dependent epimerase/dehydratase family protein [Bacteroidota bacterium]
MKVLVLGGTGAMGIHLVQLLKEQGVETFVTSRRRIQSNENVHYLQGNAQDETFLQECLQMHQWDTIVDFMIYHTQTFKERVDLLLNSTKQYIFLSSARVYAGSEQPITETSARLLDVSHDADYLATDEYSLTKARQEDILKNSGRKNWTIIRPYITYSENRFQLGVLEKEEWLYRALHGRTIVFSSDIMQKTTTLTYGFDVAKGIASVIGKAGALGECFHITQPESIQWSEVLNVYLSVLEKHAAFRPKVLLQDLNNFSEWRTGTSQYQIRHDRLYNRVFDNAKISQYIDAKSFTNTQAGLQHCLETFLKNPKFSWTDWKVEARKDRITKEKTPLSEITGIKQKVKYFVYRYLS